MRKGKEYEILIEKTEFPGFGVGNVEDKKVYVKNALPGQKILGRISKKKDSYAEAKTLEVLEDVNYKIENKCPHFNECGGCTHQFISYEKQLEFKKQQVLELLEQGDIKGFEFLGIEKSPEEFEYRNKMEFTFGDYEKGGELSLGMHIKGKSFGIVTVDSCQIIDEDYRKILSSVLKYFREKNLPQYKVMKHEGFLRNLVIRKAKNTGEILINIVTTSQIDFDFSEITEILRSMPYEGLLTGIIHSVNDSLSDVVAADKVNILFGRDYIIEKLLGLKFIITPFSFFQTNSKGAEKLYSLVRDFMEDSDSKVVFDLYCGTGTIGQIVAPNAKKVIGIELIEEAVEAANENAKLNGLNNCTFIAGDVAKVITQVKDKPDIIILDPPRPGVHPTALKYVIDFNAKDIIYVSCNPKSLVNDLTTLTSEGYVVEKVVLMDLFPHTPHIETVVKLSKKL
ncbi:23S rRNA (uracil(1939)-C(5))-methyltransferase RlmD [Clostridium sp. YIM B02515]|uniref:23S rRNA (Uracil(1939)-C(5))-methyltransferase RlmD n=1 Tax=Clostridium rhizosphaerae TaxID=2803861 RepID=A0ABS1TH22_9CLOT|nr:23S rRNA (uracil(1939)-C(5))-methyltransferase RlmD [Clostridium rhizosphaerae]MBL4938077.1 23S rRNA (uracil(1939)-C(5))-methyltransferase RlmD [Clostridium rhizosphaerae]